MGTLYLTHPFSTQIPDPGVEMMSCGLLTGSKKPVPLRSGSVTVLIRGFVADVGCELLYRNDEQGPVEAVFVFPMDAEAAIYAFQGAPASRPSSERRNRCLWPRPPHGTGMWSCWCITRSRTNPARCWRPGCLNQSQETLVQLLKSLPLAVISASTALGLLLPLFVFTDGEVGNTQDVIAEVQRHRGAHRCFSFGIGEGASTALVKGIARAAGGSTEFITGQDRMQPKVLQSLKRALQPAVTGISLSWDLPPGMEAALLGRGPEVIFPGQRCLIYAQLRGQPQLRERGPRL
ncbi:von Willebrand factor A domain-containing protein 5A-like [Mauremys reevesii]|uniref:von Willebrand factor A domain-containing protein 5A-like n=1 Tax=Mauremys reevesii TaxID=260615 RepID=UPI00193FE0AF|nr:von Willebrand factor A domain-containing protein 5A-like [Mauremys reevesii]